MNKQLDLNKPKSIFWDEKGFTTLSVVVSLLLTVTLVFSAANVYRIINASADIQNVADSCSQTAETQVAEFMILVRVCDSAILSLSLAGCVSLALSVVCACTPVTFEFSDVFLDAAKKIIESRDKFADKSASTLNNMQKALPFLASVKAYQLSQANNGGCFDANYISIAILMPSEGLEIKPGNINEIRQACKDFEENSQDIKEAASQAEEAAKKATESKLRAFMADCGNNPNYCMYERAKTKAYMTGADNPLYSSPDTWNFSVALKRTKAYYPKRYDIDKPESSSVGAQVNSALRKVFYKYADKQMQQAYVEDTGDSFKANFPHLPKNTEEMKQTSMYTDTCFPVSSNNHMHAYSGCPGCDVVVGYRSLEQLDSLGFEKCPYCEFDSTSLGKVASASTAIDNGYEYHYAIVEKAAQDYQAAKENAAPANEKVKGYTDKMFGKIKDLIKSVANKRIYAKPPGAYGVINLTVNTNSSPATKGFNSSFVESGSNLGIRAAISASTLIEEESEEGKNIINSIFDNLSGDLPDISGVFGMVLGAWSSLLSVYSSGQIGFINSIEDALNQIPLFSASGLGTWAAKRLSSFMQDVGLEPANLLALKPVLINSFYVANQESSENPDTSIGSAGKNFAVKYLTLRDNALKVNNASNDILSSISSGYELADVLNLKDVIYEGGTLEVASISPLGDLGPRIPINIRLPKFATGTMQNALNWLATSLHSILGNLWGGKVWR